MEGFLEVILEKFRIEVLEVFLEECPKNENLEETPLKNLEILVKISGFE